MQLDPACRGRTSHVQASRGATARGRRSRNRRRADCQSSIQATPTSRRNWWEPFLEAATYSGKCEPLMTATGHPTFERFSTQKQLTMPCSTRAQRTLLARVHPVSFQEVRRTGAARDVAQKCQSRKLQEGHTKWFTQRGNRCDIWRECDPQAVTRHRDRPQQSFAASSPRLDSAWSVTWMNQSLKRPPESHPASVD